MAVALNVFEAGEKAIAREVNENFSALSDEITSISESIRTDVTNAFVEAKEQILADVETVKNTAEGKLNPDLSNLAEDLEATGSMSLFSHLIPDTENIITIESGYKATELGWIFATLFAYDGRTFVFSINGKVVSTGKADGGKVGGSVSVIVKKDDEIKIEGTSSHYAYFCPMIKKISVKE